jgi:hypothetical protein
VHHDPAQGLKGIQVDAELVPQEGHLVRDASRGKGVKEHYGQGMGQPDPVTSLEDVRAHAAAF